MAIRVLARASTSNSSQDSSGSGAEINLIHAQAALSQLISAAGAGPPEDEPGPKLDLCDTAKISLDIVNAAQRVKTYHDPCVCIADQAYQLVNALDAGIKGGAIDVNPVLQDHIMRLNGDLDQIRQTIKRLESWWWTIFPCIWSAESELARCQAILVQGVDMYILLLRFSLSQFGQKDSDTGQGLKLYSAC